MLSSAFFSTLFMTPDEITNSAPPIIIIDHNMTVRYEIPGYPGNWEMNAIILSLYKELDGSDDDEDECNTSAGDLNEDGNLNILDVVILAEIILN